MGNDAPSQGGEPFYLEVPGGAVFTTLLTRSSDVLHAVGLAYTGAGRTATFAEAPAAQPDGGYLGCFLDQGDPTGTDGRDLDGMIWVDRDMTVDACRATCADDGYALAGLQNGDWCFCGSRHDEEEEADACDMPCAGDREQTCGGTWASSVYTAFSNGPRRVEQAEREPKNLLERLLDEARSLAKDLQNRLEGQ